MQQCTRSETVAEPKYFLAMIERISWRTRSVSEPSSDIWKTSFSSDTAEYNEKFIVSSEIRTRIFGFLDRHSITIFVNLLMKYLSFPFFLISSATWPSAVRRMASQYVENPVQVNVGSLDLAVSCALFLLTFLGSPGSWIVSTMSTLQVCITW